MKTIKRTLLTLAFLVLCAAFAPEKVQAEMVAGYIETPTVLTQITPKTTKVKVYAVGSSTLYVKKGQKVLAKKACKKDDIVTVTIPKQKAGSKLSFYVKGTRNGKNATSKKSTVTVKKTAQKQTKIILRVGFSSKTQLVTVKGTIGCKVYVRETNGKKKSGWEYCGVLVNTKGLTCPLHGYSASTSYTKEHYVEVRLKDLNGKYSKIAKLSLAGMKPNGQEVVE